MYVVFSCSLFSSLCIVSAAVSASVFTLFWAGTVDCSFVTFSSAALRRAVVILSACDVTCNLLASNKFAFAICSARLAASMFCLLSAILVFDVMPCPVGYRLISSGPLWTQTEALSNQRSQLHLQRRHRRERYPIGASQMHSSANWSALTVQSEDSGWRKRPFRGPQIDCDTCSKRCKLLLL